MAPPDAGAQALLVVATRPLPRPRTRPPPTGETYHGLATGIGISTTTVDRYLREALELPAAIAPSRQAIEVAHGKAYGILDTPSLRIDRVAMNSGRDRPFYAGRHQCHR